MAKQTWKPGNMVYPAPAVMVSVADKAGNTDIITAAWTGNICSDPAMTYVSVRPERFSYHMIEETQCFVINLTTKGLAKATDYCGVRSGRNVNKWKETGLTPEKADHIPAPLIGESPVNIECQVVNHLDLGSHTMFIAKVLAVHVEEAYMDEKGKFDLTAAGLMAYAHGEYLELGKKIGAFGFSVKKKPAARKKIKSPTRKGQKK
ncbi:MAG: flavin reductase family protein [Lachnospiraceae bacterium]|nr:flavin reductase family protein [Lachnospiraceae bacterium]